MLEKYKKYLPLGSIVLLKGAKKRIMITGFATIPNGSDEMYDYSACLYPEGIINSEQCLVFNHNDIERIYAIGFSDEEEKEFKVKLKEEIDKISNSNN